MPSSARRRSAANAVIFLGPATVLLAVFFLVPVVLDLVIAFTDMGQTLAVTKFTTANFERMWLRDKRLWDSLWLTFVYVGCTLTIFNVSFALILALTTTAVSDRAGAFFRAIWLLPRMSPSVVYALLWLWVVDPNEHGLLNQILVHGLGASPYSMKEQNPVVLIVLANGFIGASLGMIILTSAIRSIPKHLYYAAAADGAGPIAIAWHVILPHLRWPLSYLTVQQTLALMVSYEYIWLITNGGPFYDTTVFALYALQRAFQNGQYAYGAALALVLVVVGAAIALMLWRLMDMRRLMERPRIEVA